MLVRSFLGGATEDFQRVSAGSLNRIAEALEARARQVLQADSIPLGPDILDRVPPGLFNFFFADLPLSVIILA